MNGVANVVMMNENENLLVSSSSSVIHSITAGTLATAVSWRSLAISVERHLETALQRFHSSNELIVAPVFASSSLAWASSIASSLSSRNAFLPLHAFRRCTVHFKLDHRPGLRREFLEDFGLLPSDHHQLAEVRSEFVQVARPAEVPAEPVVVSRTVPLRKAPLLPAILLRLQPS